MSSENFVASLKQQYQEISAKLESAQAFAERETVKREIIALFKRVDGMLTELGQVKEDIRALVDKYKSQAATPPPPPPPSSPAPGR